MAKLLLFGQLRVDSLRIGDAYICVRELNRVSLGPSNVCSLLRHCIKRCWLIHAFWIRLLPINQGWSDLIAKCSLQRFGFFVNPHPVIRGLWGPGRHENCHYLKISLNLVLGFHVILKNVAWHHSWMFLYLAGELKNNYLEFNENCT